MAEKYDLIFSLGTFPLVSLLLKEKGLQIFDFPFDNVIGADFFTRMSMLLLDCNNFMEQKNIVAQENTPVEGVTQFKDTKTGFIYPNDFNPKLPVENNYPLVKANYDKYIKNLRVCIGAAKKILLVYVENPQIKEDEADNASLILEACQKFRVKYPKKVIKILYIRNNEDLENIKVIELEKNAEKMEFNFFRKFSDASAPVIEPSILAMAFTGIKLKTNWRMKKILFYQKLLKSIIEFKRNLR